MSLIKERKKKVISDYKTHKRDSGSADVQVAVLTHQINFLSSHFEKNPKDHHSRFGLIKMVSKRKKLLSFIQKNYPERYKELITRLGMRK
ncbi:MAG: 30S ribosomal protein S15 [Candidatus Omnitrophica bacterium]|nr:30S ribosomal protein S15 [Candidatus Omnitrophota bacterium]